MGRTSSGSEQVKTKQKEEEDKSWAEQWEDYYVMCLRYLPIKRLDELKQTTVEEIKILFKAHNYREIDKQEEYHWQAYLNLKVNAKEETHNGGQKYIYADFADFFDRKKVEERVFGKSEETIQKEVKEKQKSDNIQRLMLQANKINK